MARKNKTAAPEFWIHHPPRFTKRENEIIYAGIIAKMTLRRIGASVRCCRQTVRKHIRETPFLAEAWEDRWEREREEIEEAITEFVRARNPRVLMWLAERLIPEKYGPRRDAEGEECPRVIIGDILPPPESDSLQTAPSNSPNACD